MKKVIRLTESDLVRIVKRVVREQEEVSKDVEMEINNMDENDPSALERFVKKVGFKIKHMKHNSKLLRMLKKHSSKSPIIKKASLECMKF